MPMRGGGQMKKSIIMSGDHPTKIIAGLKTHPWAANPWIWAYEFEVVADAN